MSSCKGRRYNDEESICVCRTMAVSNNHRMLAMLRESLSQLPNLLEFEIQVGANVRPLHVSSSFVLEL